jgi:hypothetical protein
MIGRSLKACVAIHAPSDDQRIEPAGGALSSRAFGTMLEFPLYVGIVDIPDAACAGSEAT